jgi:ATP-binding cassette subfamily B protein
MFMNVPYKYLGEPWFWDSHQRALNAVQRNSQGVEGTLRTLIQMIPLVLQFLLSITIISKLHPFMVGLVIVISAVVFSISHHTIVQKHQIDREGTPVTRRFQQISDIMFNSSYQIELRATDTKSFLIYKGEQLETAVVNTERRKSNVQLKTDTICHLLTLFQGALLYIILILRYDTGQLSIAEWMFYLSASTVLASAVSQFSMIWIELKKNCFMVNDFREHIALDQQKQSILEPAPYPDCFISEEPLLELRNVYFSYQKNESFILKNISLKININEHIAIIGLNGAGKSTLISLITGLYTPQKGSVRYLGKEVKKLNRESYWNLFAVGFQDVNVFPFSVLSNVSMRDKKESNYEKVHAALKAVGLDREINSLPSREDTILSRQISDAGTELSGGQSQKLVLSRVIYQDRPIVILDEPTASLDPIAEKELFEQLDATYNDRTVIFVTHRLSSARFCNKIVLMDEGGVLEVGNHEELMAQHGLYEQMYRTQMSYYS